MGLAWQSGEREMGGLEPQDWDGVGGKELSRIRSINEVAQSSLTLCDPMDCSLPGSSIRGIFQARVLEWGAIAFSSVSLEAKH